MCHQEGFHRHVLDIDYIDQQLIDLSPMEHNYLARFEKKLHQQDTAGSEEEAVADKRNKVCGDINLAHFLINELYARLFILMKLMWLHVSQLFACV